MPYMVAGDEEWEIAAHRRDRTHQGLSVDVVEVSGNLGIFRIYHVSGCGWKENNVFSESK
jgi:hypothetical protein